LAFIAIKRNADVTIVEKENVQNSENQCNDGKNKIEYECSLLQPMNPADICIIAEKHQFQMIKNQSMSSCQGPT